MSVATLLANPEFVRLAGEGWNAAQLRERFGAAHGSIVTYRRARSEACGVKLDANRKRNAARRAGKQSLEEPTPEPSLRQRLTDAQAHPPTTAPLPDAEREAYQREIARLREQLTWAQHKDATHRTGGKATLVRSDLHFGDRSHMLRSYESLCDKALIVLEQYQPEEITILSNGDEVAGRGIYREQNVDSVLQLAEQQVSVAAMKMREFDTRVKEQFPSAKVKWLATRGNHDRALGEPLTSYLVLTARALGVDCTYCGDSVILNLASQGTYHLWAEHGYGYSDLSPSSKKWFEDMKTKLLRFGRRYYGEERIRRVTHGHTHWHSLGHERILDVVFDTTGGTQRNERVLLGKNERPLGWIAYLSPAGCDGILSPVGIQPDLELLEEELADPFLFQRNMEDCAKTLREYMELCEQLGLTACHEPEGR